MKSVCHIARGCALLAVVTASTWAVGCAQETPPAPPVNNAAPTGTESGSTTAPPAGGVESEAPAATETE